MSKLRELHGKYIVMKRYMLLVVFLLAFVGVADSVVYSWILSVNPVDTNEGKQTNPDNNTKGNSTVQGVSTDIKSMPAACHMNYSRITQ